MSRKTLPAALERARTSVESKDAEHEVMVVAATEFTTVEGDAPLVIKIRPALDEFPATK